MRFPLVPLSTRRFTWLHVPKTGGTWLYHQLTSCAAPSWDLRHSRPAHVRLHVVPWALTFMGCPERVGLPIVASVRNPWDWYVSLYFFMEQHYVNRTGGFIVARAEWSPSCEQWASVHSHGNNIEGFRESLPRLMEMSVDERNHATARPQEDFLRAHDGGLGVLPVRFESLRFSMLERLHEVGAEVPQSLSTALRKSARVNASRHAPYGACYTPELRDLVTRYHGWLIDTFEYQFD